MKFQNGKTLSYRKRRREAKKYKKKNLQIHTANTQQVMSLKLVDRLVKLYAIYSKIKIFEADRYSACAVGCCRWHNFDRPNACLAEFGQDCYK